MLFRPGDILLFESSKWSFNNIVPKMIRLVTGNKIVHVGIVLDIKHYSPDWIVWAETFTGYGMRGNLSSIERLKEDSDNLKLLGVAHLPDSWYQRYPIESKFTEVGRQIAKDKKSKSYSYRTIISFMIDHFYRLFRPKNEPYRVWLKPNGYVCSTLCATIINETMKKYNPNWCGSNSNMDVWEPDNFATSPFMVELCDSKIF